VTLATIFYCLGFDTSLFVASYDSQGYDGGKVNSSQRAEVRGGWRKLHNEKLHSMYSSKRMTKTTELREEMGGPCVHIWKSYAYKTLLKELEGNI
jgi:hypothetical protein